MERDELENGLKSMLMKCAQDYVTSNWQDSRYNEQGFTFSSIPVFSIPIPGMPKVSMKTEFLRETGECGNFLQKGGCVCVCVCGGSRHEGLENWGK